jgi:hypothetical protein
MTFFNRLLFDMTPIGARVLVGTDEVEIRADFAGVRDGVLTLTRAQIRREEREHCEEWDHHEEREDREDRRINVLRIPVHNITFFAQL